MRDLGLRKLEKAPSATNCRRIAISKAGSAKMVIRVRGFTVVFEMEEINDNSFETYVTLAMMQTTLSTRCPYSLIPISGMPALQTWKAKYVVVCRTIHYYLGTHICGHLR